MALNLTIFDHGRWAANADLSSDQYHAVKLLSTGKVDVAGANDPAIGILQDKPRSGESSNVRLIGVSPMVVDGSGTAIAPGDPLEVDASGRGVKSTTAGHNVVAKALDACTIAGGVISVLMTGPYTL